MIADVCVCAYLTQPLADSVIIIIVRGSHCHLHWMSEFRRAPESNHRHADEGI